MPQTELVAELKTILEKMPSEKLDELLLLLRAENARIGDTTSPCPARLEEE